MPAISIRSTDMMPTYFPPQRPGQVPPGPFHGPDPTYACHHSNINAVTPSKRQVDQEDDDIQFISEKPVKRRRVSEKRPTMPVAEQLTVPTTAAASTTAAPCVVPNLSTTAIQMPEGDLRDTERRLSTGMVGLPHDMQAVALTYALRGVSMPGLESFVLDQPLRKPRPPSPPELSPKQLPSAISPAAVDVLGNRNAPEAFDSEKLPGSHVLGESFSQTLWKAHTPMLTPNSVKGSPDTQQIHASQTSMHSGSQTNPTSSSLDKNAGSNSIPMLPPAPLPYSQASHHAPCSGSSPTPSENHHHHHHSNSAHSQKQPCQVCSQLRRQAQLSRAQGLPVVNTTFPSHFVPQLHCHASYGQHIHHPMMAMPMGSNMHQFGPNYAPVMMPTSSNAFVSVPSHTPPQHLPQQMTPQQPKETEKDNQHASERSSKAQSQPNQAKNAAVSSNAVSSPVKPPTSLIKSNYRKPSPNLIVDVAETCQEKFPFEEVAKRHNVPVDKVFDVFAAIIQVPLLRCPTDRRRAGRLATARVKEYNKTKKDIRDSRAGHSEGQMPEAAVTSTDIAQRLGQVEFPEGFTLGGNRK
ncbi:hypothetical protein F4678DRAFT_87006 [Xylaria arbuscula]|nr:hypothetical protein F4678DRAFT_87006 [Xylaria arbuscula]